MRGVLAALFLAPSLIGIPAPLFGATVAEPPKPRNVLLFVASGLRPCLINEQTAPAITALLRRGVTFANTYAAFPTLATPNAASLATGHLPGDTGALNNMIYAGFPVPVASPSVTPDSGSAAGGADDRFANNGLAEETILHAAAMAGFSTAAIGAPGLFDHKASPGQSVVVDDRTGRPGGIALSADMQAAFQEFGVAAQAPLPGDSSVADPPAGGKPVTNAGRRTWFADVASLAVLPTFKERHKPFVMMFWSRDSSATPGDQSGSPLRLIPGINAPASLAAIKEADNDLARVLTTLKELGLESTTDVILASDHGASTISKESATSYAAGRSYKDVPAALLPPGFVAIDLARALRMSLFDPDATGDAKKTPVPAGNFPVRGNGLIGDDAARPEVVVLANGGSDLIYVPSTDKLMGARIVQVLAAQDYVSGVFVDSRLGLIAGTLPLSAAGLEGAALTQSPAIVVNFRTFTTGCADPTACGVAVADTVLQQGQGAAGSFSRADTRILMGAAGPGFRNGFQDLAPASTADLGRTIAALLGLKPRDKGKLTGRVLTEALPNGAPVFAKPGILKSAPDDSGIVTELRLQTIGATRYFDAAGYPGRTLGLD